MMALLLRNPVLGCVPSHNICLSWPRPGGNSQRHQADPLQLDSDVKRKTFTPELDFHDWAIAGPEVNTHLKGLDPMVPYGGKYIEDPGDEALEKMAKDAAGKELLFLTYRDMKHCLPPRKKGSDNEPAS